MSAPETQNPRRNADKTDQPGLPLVLEEVSVRRGARSLVSALSFSLRKDEGIVALLGANGAGKTTTLRLVHGLVAPSEGVVRWAAGSAREIVSPPALSASRARRLRAGQGFVSQSPVLLARSVARNMSHALAPLGLSRDERRARVRDALALVGLAGCETRAAGSLSAGEAQRLCLARALARRPALLLLDEATAFLDAKHARAIEASVAAARDVVTIFVTQDPAQARRLARRVLFIEEGRLCADMSSDAFFAAPPSAARGYLRDHSLLVAANGGAPA